MYLITAAIAIALARLKFAEGAKHFSKTLHRTILSGREFISLTILGRKEVLNMSICALNSTKLAQ